MKGRFLGAAAAVLTLGVGLAASGVTVHAAPPSTPASGTTTVAGGPATYGTPDQLNNPYGVTVDRRGNVYIADTFNHRVQKWAPGATSGTTVAGGALFGGAPTS